MNFEDIKWAMRELAASLKGHSNCNCAQHNRLVYPAKDASSPHDTTPTGFRACEQPATSSRDRP